MGHTPRTLSGNRRFSLTVILVLCLSCIAMSADAASTRGLPVTTPTTPAFGLARTIDLVTIPPTPQTITCEAPCQCMERSQAIVSWGSDGFTQCAEKTCGYIYTIAGAPIEKYCFKQKATTTPPPVRYVPLVTTTPTYVHLVTIPIVTETTIVPKKLVTPDFSLISDDTDQDSIPDDKDNCPAVFNPGQDDTDRIFIGCPPGAVAKMPDAGALALCAELTVETARKKCEEAAWKKANPGFTGAGCDYNSDAKGDVCDNCWNVQNPDQTDSDGDCAVVKQNSTFWDGSKWLQDPHCGNACDNCPQVANPEKLDSNNDGIGDACSCPWCTNQKVRPVYISGQPESKIDIVLIPSSTGWDMEHSIARQRDDYNKTESVFRVVVLDNIQNGYFRLDSYSTSPVPADFRKRFNFYYYWDPASPADAHSSCGGTLPAGFDTGVPFRDAAIIIYPKVLTSQGGFPIGGCSAGFGIPAQITAPGFWPPTLLHESGHGVFGLVDTYCSRPGIDTSYSQNDPYSNVWTSEFNCKHAPTSTYGTLNPANCRRIEADDPATPKNPDCSIDYWRYDPDPDDMRDCDFTSRFGTASVRRIDHVFESFTSL